ncbi:hypothetical protein FOA52_011657 [Chlamydomonas sp. UWO 241]|nr:hypothetical protein FOA52_011657 [Chlamydomonas sp. UWO 241]
MGPSRPTSALRPQRVPVELSLDAMDAIFMDSLSLAHTTRTSAPDAPSTPPAQQEYGGGGGGDGDGGSDANYDVHLGRRLTPSANMGFLSGHSIPQDMLLKPARMTRCSSPDAGVVNGGVDGGVDGSVDEGVDDNEALPNHRTPLRGLPDAGLEAAVGFSQKVSVARAQSASLGGAPPSPDRLPARSWQQQANDPPVFVPVTEYVGKGDHLFYASRAAITVSPGPFVPLRPRPVSAGGACAAMPLMPSQRALLELHAKAVRIAEADKKAAEAEARKRLPKTAAAAVDTHGKAKAAPADKARPAAGAGKAWNDILAGAGAASIARRRTSAEDLAAPTPKCVDGNEAIVGSYVKAAARARVATASVAAAAATARKPGSTTARSSTHVTSGVVGSTALRGRASTATGRCRKVRPSSAPPVPSHLRGTGILEEVTSKDARPRLEGRLAVEQAKQDARSAAIAATSPLRYKTTMPLSGAVVRLHYAGRDSAAANEAAKDASRDNAADDGDTGISGTEALERAGERWSTDRASPGGCPEAAPVVATAAEERGEEVNGSCRKPQEAAPGSAGRSAFASAAYAHPTPSPPPSPARGAARHAHSTHHLAVSAASADASCADHMELERRGRHADGFSGAEDRVGEIERLYKRYRRGGDPDVLYLSNTVRGANQMVAVADLMLQVPEIRALCISSNDITDISMRPLLGVLADPVCQNLEDLDAANNRLSAVSVNSMCPLLLRERDRALAGVHVPPPPPLCAWLRELSLSGNPIGDTGTEVLAGVVGHHACRLRSLDLSKCGITERGASVLAPAIAASTVLQSLDLSWNSLGKRGARFLAGGLVTAQSVQQVHLAWTGIGDEGASHIASALVDNISVRLIDLSGNSLGVETCIVLGEVLQENERLDTILLRDNPIGHVGAKRLLRAMARRAEGGALQIVDLLNCGLTAPGAVSADAGGHAVSFNPNEPDGDYELDLSRPAERQVALELLQLARLQGAKTWRGATVSGRRFRLASMSKQILPEKGTLRLEFKSARAVGYTDNALSPSGFDMMWTAMVSVQPMVKGATTGGSAAGLSRRSSYASSSMAASTAPHRARNLSPAASLHAALGGSSRPGSASAAPGGVFSGWGGGIVAHPPSPTARPSSAAPHRTASVSGAIGTRPSSAAAARDSDGGGAPLLSGPPPLGFYPVAPSSPSAHYAAYGTGPSPTRRVRAYGSDPSGGSAAGDMFTRGSAPPSPSLMRAGAAGLPVLQEYMSFRERADANEEVEEFEDLLPPGSPLLVNTGGASVAEVFTFSSPHAAVHTWEDHSAMPVALDAGNLARLAAAAAADAETDTEPWQLGTTASECPASDMIGAGALRMADVPDDWKMSLLGPMLEDYYFTCSQLSSIAASFTDPALRVDAVLKGFGTLTDPENMHQVLAGLPEALAESIRDRLGPLVSFNPGNPTGSYQLVLSNPGDRSVARRLLVSYIQQWDANLCVNPYHMAFVSCTRDGSPVDVTEPHRMKLPKEGLMKILFVDLRPMPEGARQLTTQQFQVLVGLLVSEEELDPQKVLGVIDDPAVHTSQDLVRKYVSRSCLPRDSPALQSLLTMKVRPGSANPGRLRPGSEGGLSGGAAAAVAAVAAAASSGTPGSRKPLRGGTGRASSEPRAASAGQSRLGDGGRMLHRMMTVERGVPSDASVAGYVDVLRESAVFTGSVAVRDMAGLSETLRAVALHHYATCEQLMELLELLPADATPSDFAELVSIFWARTVDRAARFTDVMRRLDSEAQVLVSQRLGYFQVFNHKRPELHYRLRMFRADEHEVAWQLFNMAMTAPHDCFVNVSINGEPKKINQGPTMWSVMRGSCRDTDVPSVTVEFDFEWPESGRGDQRALLVIQGAIAQAKETVRLMLEEQEATAPASPGCLERNRSSVHRIGLRWKSSSLGGIGGEGSPRSSDILGGMGSFGGGFSISSRPNSADPGSPRSPNAGPRSPTPPYEPQQSLTSPTRGVPHKGTTARGFKKGLLSFRDREPPTGRLSAVASAMLGSLQESEDESSMDEDELRGGQCSPRSFSVPHPPSSNLAARLHAAAAAAQAAQPAPAGTPFANYMSATTAGAAKPPAIVVGGGGSGGGGDSGGVGVVASGGDGGRSGSGSGGGGRGGRGGSGGGSHFTPASPPSSPHLASTPSARRPLSASMSIASTGAPPSPVYRPRSHMSALGFLSSQPHVQQGPGSGTAWSGPNGASKPASAAVQRPGSSGGVTARPVSAASRGDGGPDLRLFSKQYNGLPNFQLTDLEED